MDRIVKLSDIAYINRETYKKVEIPSFLNYLDTGNLTRNKVEKYQFIDTEKDKIPSRAQRKVKYETILYSTVRPNQEHYGFVDNLVNNLIVSTGFATIDIFDKNVHPKFIYYLITQNYITQYLHTIGMNSVTSYPSISPNNLGELKFSLPEFAKQKQIAKVLSDLDSKIELNNKINAELEAMAKLIYDYWFVQFDYPDKNGKPYKSSGGKMVYNKELKREIPVGWEVEPLSNKANITTGKLDSNAEVIGGEFPFYTCASEPTTTDKYAFNDTVILVAGNNAAGNFHINRYKGKFNAYQRTYIFTSKSSSEMEYLYQILKLETKILKSQGKGSQTKFLTISMLTGIKTFTKTGIMEKFDKIVKPMYEEQVVVSKQNQQLSELRDWLLPMLMNGQVRVGGGK